MRGTPRTSTPSRRWAHALGVLGAVGLLTPASALGAPDVPLGKAVYIKVSDQGLYLHANGGSKPGAEQTLHPCPKGNNHPNCQWVFEPSPTRAGAYYVKVSDQGLYLHAHGGASSGAQETLHPCPKGNDHANCQWFVEASPSRPGAIYLRAADSALYLHANGGSNPGAKETLHPCPKGSDHPNCQWIIEGGAPAPQPPPPPPPQAVEVPTGERVYLKVSDQSLYLHANGGSTAGAEQTLHPCPKGREHPNCQWVFERSPTRAGAYYVKVSDQDLYLHAQGGASPDAQQTLHSCPKGADHANCQWYAEASLSRPGAIYLRSAGAQLYLHASGGSRPGAKETLHACPKGNDHGNCQWVLERAPAPVGTTADSVASKLQPGTKLYLKISDQPLYLHAQGGSSAGASETLHPCPKSKNHGNCQWVLEPSPTRVGAWYLRVSDQPLYLHAHGGASPAAQETLHPCPMGSDFPNCQWYFEDSTTRPGASYLRSAGGALYLHASGGSQEGAMNTLHPCPKNADHPNCQWTVEVSAPPTQLVERQTRVVKYVHPHTKQTVTGPVKVVPYGPGQFVYSIQGDILVRPVREGGPDYILADSDFLNSQERWPDTRVPYEIADGNPNAEVLRQAIALWNSKINIRWVPREGQADFVRFTEMPAEEKADGDSFIGRQGGMQLVRTKATAAVGTALHEMGHAVGLHHEMASPLRDNFLTIYTDRLDEDCADQYEVAEGVSHGDCGFDASSMMMYSPRACMKGTDPVYTLTSNVPMSMRERHRQLFPAAYPAGDRAARWFVENLQSGFGGNGLDVNGAPKMSPCDISGLNELYPAGRPTGGAVSCTSPGDCGGGACSRREVDTDDMVCCPSGKESLKWGYYYCTELPNGAKCYTDGQCASKSCDHKVIKRVGRCK